MKSEAQSLKLRGILDSNLVQRIQSLLETQVPWDEVVEDWVSRIVQSPPTARTWKYLHNRLLHFATLPGIKTVESRQFGDAVFALDTSGSMSIEDIRKLLYIVKKFTGSFRKIFLIQHSVKVKKVTVVESHFSEIDSQSFLQRLGKILGRGGTSHYDLFTKIQEIYEEDPDALSGVCLLTDGYSDLQTIWKSFEWVKVVPISIISPPDGNNISGLRPKPTMIKIN